MSLSLWSVLRPWPRARMPFAEASAPQSSSSLTIRALGTRAPRATMEDAFESACASRVIPGAVLMAGDDLGRLMYSRAFGVRSVQDGSENEPLSVDSVMYVASCTKLLTTVAALQCVERGLVTLDDDLRPIVHELQDLDILQGGGNGGMVSKRKNTAPITLRQLLTHQSGFSYQPNEPLLQQWRKEQGVTGGHSSRSLRGRFLHPLLYEPETSWSYGPSVDWAGVVVERLTQLTLQEYMRSNIWQPLGIRDMTFFLSTRPDMQARAAHMTRRVRSGGPAEKNGALVYAPAQPAPDPDAEDCLGGEGLFASPRELFKVVHAVLLACGPSSAPDTSTIPAAQLLLRRSTAESMFRPQLGRPGREALQRAAEIPRLNRLMGDMPVSAAKDWGLGGLLLMDDLPGWRGKGTMTWGGSPNLNWWIDPAAGLCGLYASQLMPFGDEKSVQLAQLFEKEMYARRAAAGDES